MPLTAQPRTLYYCAACHDILTLDRPCPHVHQAPPPRWTWLGLLMVLAVNVVGWGSAYLGLRWLLGG